MDERIRVVIAAPAADAHDRAAQAVAHALRDAGMEVVYTGRSPTAEDIVATVVQEDADAVGLAGADPSLLSRVAELLGASGAGDVVVFGGGREPGRPPEEPGGATLFPPGTAPAEIVGWIRSAVAG